MESVAAVVDKLEIHGVTLGHPHSSAIRGSEAALRELRPKRGRSPLRVFYAFDPKRQAVLLLGGDKSGESQHRFYERVLPRVLQIWDAYLADVD